MHASNLSRLAMALCALPVGTGTQSALPAAYVSTSDGVHRLAPWTAPTRGTASEDGNVSTWALGIDDTVTGHKQTVRGFGAAVTDATVAAFNSLPADRLATLLDTLMATERDDGAGFAVIRHTIAASDLSGDPVYSYDDAGGRVDTILAEFGLGERGTAMATLLAQMRARRPDLTLMGSVWSPPGWMKLNGVIVGTTIDNNLNHSYVDTYAQYFVKYLQAYASLGAHVDAISIQNEPLASFSGYPTMYIYAHESGELIQVDIGPALRAAGLDVAIWAYDHNTDVPSYAQTVLDTAAEFVKTVAWHCYAPNNTWSTLTAFHNNNTAVEQIMTECWTSSGGLTSWHAAADFTLGPLQNWATGALAWTLGTDTNEGPHLSSGGCNTCRGLVTVDVNARTYEFQVDYYMMAQFSRFMPKGAVVLSGTDSHSYSIKSGLESVATLNPDGTRTVVIVNKFDDQMHVTLTTKSGDIWSGSVPAESVTTWLLPAIGA